MANSGTGSTEVELANNREIDGILWGHRWANPNLTYSFPSSIGEYAGYEGITGFGSFSNFQSAPIAAIIANFNAVCGLNITYTSGTGANLRFAEATVVDYSDAEGEAPHRPGTPNVTAEANPPDPFNIYTHAFGDMWFNPGLYESPVVGDFAYAAGLMHEIGHAVGLAHGHETQVIDHTGHADTKPTLTPDHDSQEYSVMTYKRYPGSPATGASNADYPQSLMQNDIEALQYLYGADFTNNNDTTYRWNTETGANSINGIAGATPVRNKVFLTVWDGGGTDTYDFSNYTRNLDVDLNPGKWTILDTSSAQLQRAFLGADDGVNHWARGNIANALLYKGDVRSLIENAIGGSGKDTITGNSAANTLTGNGGADILFGNNGNDRFEGGFGADDLNGGNGTDQAQYTFATSGVTVDLIFTLTNSGEATGDTFDSIENLRGSAFNDVLRGDDSNNAVGGWTGGNDKIEGRGGDDFLAGGNGNDTLIDGTGSDIVEGGVGDDLYLIADAQGIDILTEGANAGRDTVQTAVSWILAANFEDLILTGTANANGSGNAVANRIAGNAGQNVLQGFDGVDRLEGGTGNDTYVLSDLVFTGTAGGFRYDSVIEAASAGTDTIIVTAIDNPGTVFGTDGYTLSSAIENGIITGTLNFNLTGNALANTLTGNDGVNVLSGGEAGDTYKLTSLAKRNSAALWRYDDVVDTGTTGVDTVRVTAVDNPDTNFGTDGYTLGSKIENGIITGRFNFNLTGNALANTLTGNGGVNVLSGGEAGDTYKLTSLARFNSAALWRYDDVVDTGTTGFDTVRVTAVDNPDTVFGTDGYTLGSSIENGMIMGTLNFNLAGNALANTLIGNLASNTLSGSDGADKLVGGTGRDFLSGGNGRDLFDFNAIGETGATAATRDKISDFTHDIDDIDLRTIDASTKVTGDQAFNFIGAASFHNVAGELRYVQTNAAGSANDSTVVSGDINGDSKADFQIELSGLISLTNGDFLL